MERAPNMCFPLGSENKWACSSSNAHAASINRSTRQSIFCQVLFGKLEDELCCSCFAQMVDELLVIESDALHPGCNEGVCGASRCQAGQSSLRRLVFQADLLQQLRDFAPYLVN